MCSSTMKDRAVPTKPSPACSKNSNETSRPFWLILLSLLFFLPTSQLLSQRTIGNFNTANRSDILSLVDECDAAASPGFGQTTVDGDISDWDLTNDFFANMYEAGNPTKDLLSKAYLRYNCETNTLCILVLMEPGQPADNSPSDSWMKIYDISNSVQIDGNSSNFALLPNQGGWEGCFSLAEGSYAEVEIHVNSNGRTSSTGKRAQGYKPLCIKCPDCPPAGQTCDDNDPSTENDVTDGECGCAGTPCPDAGQTCDDNDPTTENDVTDGECGCAGTPCPDAGQTCDDNDPSTENDVTDGECGCAGTPCPDAGQTCDDNDPTTENDVTDGECGCAGTPCPDAGQTCDDNDPTTENDVTDGECGCAGTPCPDAGQTCNDNDPTTENDVTDGECGCAGTPCPDAGQTCDDNDPTTENDVTDGECGCAGTPCPDAGQTCDDNDPTTENDVTDGECGCAGTPCPDAGQTCDDNDPTTENDVTDGECGCAGTPCPDAGQTCDDNDPTTENDVTDGECGCAGTPCPDAGQTCDDNDPTTENDVTDGECGCAGTPCPDAGQTCDDNDPTTENDVTDGECGCAGTPCPDAGQTCDDNDPTTENDVTDGECGCAGTPCPDAGQTCDDNDPTTENDVTDGECGCAGTPCPDAGQTCDDNDPTTENDVTDGECGCAGTPCPDAGQTCDDNDPSTENDVTDGECGCAGTPCTAEGKDCDDYDCNTNDYYDPSICDCVYEPIAPPSCDDHDECTTDYYDAENCQCVNEPIDDLNCGEGTIDCEGQTEATYDPETERYTLYADGCWHDCLSPDRDVHFYQELCGDGELIARVVSITGSGHAGVVMRESEDPVARRVGAMTKLYSNTVRREYREEYGAPVHQMPAFRPGVEWFRMIRTGNQVKVYTSKRGDYWRLLYKVTYPNLAACLDVGLMAYSSSGGTDITAVFDNVQLIPAGSSNSTINQTSDAAKQATQGQQLGADSQNPFTAKVELLDGYEVNQRLQVFPNPAKGETFVNLPALEGDEKAILSLYNSVGQEVLRRQVDPSISRTEAIRLADLDPGVYVFRLKVQGQKDLTQRLVIGR